LSPKVVKEGGHSITPPGGRREVEKRKIPFSFVKGEKSGMMTGDEKVRN